MCPSGTGYNYFLACDTAERTIFAVVAGSSGKLCWHSPFARQRRRKAMPARIRGKSQLSIAREGFLDRRSKRCFWLLLSPQTKVARAGARNSPCAGCGRDEGVLRRCGGDTSSAPFGGTCLPAGRSTDLTRHRVSFNTANPSRGRLTEACHSTPRPIKGEGLGVRR